MKERISIVPFDIDFPNHFFFFFLLVFIFPAANVVSFKAAIPTRSYTDDIHAYKSNVKRFYQLIFAMTTRLVWQWTINDSYDCCFFNRYQCHCLFFFFFFCFLISCRRNIARFFPRKKERACSRVHRCNYLYLSILSYVRIVNKFCAVQRMVFRTVLKNFRYRIETRFSQIKFIPIYKIFKYRNAILIEM